ncbi:hypothetical protein ZWY2020_044842 [Hordeum vulgare]|nr:hypothetical protein ZWY2020_044842 [Hordeum vulgare]
MRGGESLAKPRVPGVQRPAHPGRVHWTYDPETSSLSVAFFVAPLSACDWVAWGAQPHRRRHGRHAGALRRSQSGAPRRRPSTYDIQGASLGSPGRIAYPTSDLAAVLGSDDRVQMFGKLTLHNGTEEVNQVW